MSNFLELERCFFNFIKRVITFSLDGGNLYGCHILRLKLIWGVWNASEVALILFWNKTSVQNKKWESKQKDH